MERQTERDGMGGHETSNGGRLLGGGTKGSWVVFQKQKKSSKGKEK